MKIAIVLSCFLVAFLSCSSQKVSGTISDTDTGKLAMVYSPDKSPAIGATVKFFEVNDTTRQAAAETKTDNNGRYTVTGLVKGSYNILAKQDALVAFQDSVYISPDTNFVQPETLSEAGSIFGIVGLQPNHDPRTVTVQVLGTDNYSNADANGKFTINQVARGSYLLRLVTTLPDYTPTFNSIRVDSVNADTLPDTLFLTFTGIPVVAGLNVAYDTANGIVRLCWHSTPFRNFQNYLVFKDLYDSIDLSPSPIRAQQDTILFDTIFSRKKSVGPFSFTDTNDYHFKYRVSIEDNTENKGATYKYVSIVAISPSKVGPKVLLATNTPNVSINDTIRLSAGASDRFAKIVKWEWSIGDTSTWKVRAGGDTVIIAPSHENLSYLCAVRVTDEAGNRSVATVWAKVEQDAPVVLIRDTVAGLDSTTMLPVSVQQKYGKIVFWKCDFEGDSVWDDSGSSLRNLTHVYTKGGVFHPRLMVRDDDGNVSTEAGKLLVATILPIDLIQSINLTASKSPYLIKDHVEIHSMATLSVAPGTEIQLAPSAYLTATGKLVAVGTEAQPILFTNLYNSDSSYFGGIFIRTVSGLQIDSAGNYVDGSKMVHCVVQHGGAGEGSRGSALTNFAGLYVSDCLFQKNIGGIRSYDSLYISNSRISQNNGNGIYSGPEYYSSVSYWSGLGGYGYANIYNCRISDNTGTGILEIGIALKRSTISNNLTDGVRTSSGVEIDSSEVYSNLGYGYWTADGGYGVTIHNCNLYGNGKLQLAWDYYCGDVSGNYWGVDSIDNIWTAIRISDSDQFKNCQQYLPILTEQIQGVGSTLAP